MAQAASEIQSPQIVLNDEITLQNSHTQNDPVLSLKKQIKHLKKDLLLAQYNMREEFVRESKLQGITLHDKEAIESVFKRYDLDGDGEISIGELGNFFKALGEPLTEDETREAINLMSKNNSTGKIQFTDFLMFWLDIHKINKNSQFVRKFKLANSVLLRGDTDFDSTHVRYHRSGEEYTLDYRVHFYYVESKELRHISPWHDIPLYNTGYGENATILHMVNEIPKYTRAKYEIATREQFNPIKQDVKNGRVRFYQYGDLGWNYGALPQTYEDPEHISPETGYPGDNDPIDVIEIGARQIPVGAVVPVKILGILALIDDGETDWKCIAVNVNDPIAHLLNNIDDVHREHPGLLNAIREYFRKYKVCTGLPENSFGLEEKVLDRNFALKIIHQTHLQWKKLRQTENVPEPAFTPVPSENKKSLLIRQGSEYRFKDHSDTNQI